MSVWAQDVLRKGNQSEVSHDPDNGGMGLDRLERARRGDADAFRELVEPYRRQLEVHCYRMLGSAQDAEDATQEIMLAAWEGFTGFEGRSSIRTWLYRVATRRCLNALRSTRRRPVASSLAKLDLPSPTRLGDVPLAGALSGRSTCGPSV